MQLKTLTLDEVRREHPEALRMVEVTLRKSRSKHRREPLEALSWVYEAAVSIDGPEPLGLEARIQDRVRRTSTALVASCGKWFHSVGVSNPPEVEGWHRSVLEGLEAERRRVQALSPGERAQELERALAVLRRGKGFIEVP